MQQGMKRGSWGRGALIGTLLAGGMLAGSVQAAPFVPGAHKGPKQGVQNEVAVLGTAHLSHLPATFDPASLGELIDRLAAWKPQAIAIETVSGQQCDMLRRYPGRYALSIKDYCPDLSAAKEATGLDVPAATAAAEKLLSAWPAQPTAAQRRTLAALFLAAGEPDSALVQWLRLPEADRVADDNLKQTLVDALEASRVNRNETTLVAAPLAARLGHERLWPMDDHSSDQFGPNPKAYVTAIRKAWDNPAVKRRSTMFDGVEAQVDTPERALAMYRRYNQPDVADIAFESDYGAALEEPSAPGYGRMYVTSWETRNLRMAANVRDLLGPTPGMRALVIVGASHKAYLDAYLEQMHDVRIVDVTPLLK
ncbi:DUF5694 domain-containing protein [Stenotrophomonas sp. LGBM10]|uniref:DUF5694 domain-containing protein n=1 Tax=Stenotrophomonas sp. LGBM10 TaxID=3390038 RepID=UPI00398A6D96